jgi:hypothetical protein
LGQIRFFLASFGGGFPSQPAAWQLFFLRLKTQSFSVVPPIEQLRAINRNGHFPTLICGDDNTQISGSTR